MTYMTDQRFRPMRKAALLLCGVMFFTGLQGVRPAAAVICEDPATPVLATSAAQTAEAAAVTAATSAIIAAVETATSSARSVIVTAMNLDWLEMKTRLNKFWTDWEEAQKGQTAQLSGGQNDQTRNLGSVHDAAVLDSAARNMETAEYKSKLQYIPVEEGCRFDTAAPYLSRAMRVSTAISSAGVHDQKANLSNNKNSPAGNGNAALQKKRVADYKAIFCDPAINNAAGGCAVAGSHPRANVEPSETFFGSATINLADADTVTGVQALIDNLTSADEAPNPVDKDVLKTSQGREQRMHDRERLTQADAIAAPLWSIVGERASGVPATEIQALRERLGIVAPSGSPSEYEIRKQIVESLWDPAYYAGLQDNGPTVAQKEIYLKAYSLLLLSKIYDKTERIANLYVIQGSNMIDATSTGAASGDRHRPLRP